MATPNDPGLLRGERTEPEIGEVAGRFTCAFHAYSGTEPCSYCIESGRTVEGVIYRDFKSVGVPWVDSCPKCASTDIRHCRSMTENFAWCGACGKRDGQ